MIGALLFGFLPLAIWAYLLLGRGMFWRMCERDDLLPRAEEPARWPSVVAIVPARNEAALIARSIGSLLAQDYPGSFRIILVDDESEDGTGDIARGLDDTGKLTVMRADLHPPDWTGKLWAVSQGVRAAGGAPDFLWLTDADIAHAPDNLHHMAIHAETNGLAMVSLMAKLNCETWAERFFIPAFVYFFDMLYPFAWVNARTAKTAAAAGGCMLIRCEALEAAGGIAAIRGNIIDDCAMGRLLKMQEPIWLGLTRRAVSIRPYVDMGEIARMISRSAYAQLDYSPLILAGTLAGLGLTFLAAPIWALFGWGLSRIAAAAAWAMMAASFWPMLKFYGRSPLWGIALPAIALLYAVFTFDSALQHWRGRGGMWKGRPQAMAQR